MARESIDIGEEEERLVEAFDSSRSPERIDEIGNDYGLFVQGEHLFEGRRRTDSDEPSLPQQALVEWVDSRFGSD